MCILWFIVCIVQVVIAFIVYVIYHDRRKLVETSNCDRLGDACVCYNTDQTRVTTIGKESSGMFKLIV